MDEEKIGVAWVYFPRPSITSIHEIGDQLEVVAKLKGEKERCETQSRSQRFIAELGIEDCYGQYPNQMSGGQKQRCGIRSSYYYQP